MAFANDPYVDLTYFTYSNSGNAIIVTFGSLLSHGEALFPMHHAFWKKRYKIFFSINILQKVSKNISNKKFF